MDLANRLITATQLKQALDAGSAPQLIDVRQPWEYEEFHLPGARLIPLPELPERLGEVDLSRPVVTYCASGRRSLSAAEILAGHAPHAQVRSLEGGIMGWHGVSATGSQDQGFTFFPSQVTPLQVLGLAYRMEDNLGRFYGTLADGALEEDLRGLFKRLHAFEEGHKAMVLRLARTLKPAVTAEMLTTEAPALDALEGGIAAETMRGEQAQALAEPRTALDVAMMFEAQALDLYTRLARTLAEAGAREQCQTLAEEETRHLRALGRMLDSLGPRQSA